MEAGLSIRRGGRGVGLAGVPLPVLPQVAPDDQESEEETGMSNELYMVKVEDGNWAVARYGPFPQEVAEKLVIELALKNRVSSATIEHAPSPSAETFSQLPLGVDASIVLRPVWKWYMGKKWDTAWQPLCEAAKAVYLRGREDERKALAAHGS